MFSMYRKGLCIILLSIFCLGSGLGVYARSIQASFGRETFSLNSDWAFFLGEVESGDPSSLDFDDTRWRGVSIPHVMRIEPKHNGGQVFQGVGWYRKYLSIPSSYKDKRLTLHFDGVQMNCAIFMNGQKVAEHAGGYIGFVVDISDYIRYDEQNVLSVRVVSMDDPHTPPAKPMDKLDFNYYGGIYRDVNLLVTDKLYITEPLEVDKVASGGVRVHYPQVSDSLAVIDCHSHVMNGWDKDVTLRIETVLVDHEQTIIAKQTSSAILKSKEDAVFHHTLDVLSPILWHPDHPYLYVLETHIYAGNRLIDSQQRRIGIRTISFLSPTGAVDGFYINGKKLYVRGANRHQAYPYVGDAASTSMQYRDALILKRGGFNAVRAAHYPPSPAFLDACDEVGLLVVECQPGWQYYSHDSLFVERSYRDIRRMIRRDRNHPSVFLWETSLNESPTPAIWMEKAVRIAHEEMPDGQFFTADDLNPRSKDFYDVFYKVIDRDGNDPLPDRPSMTREWGDAWHADPTKENGLRASRIYSEKGLLTQTLLRQKALNGEIREDHGGYWDHAGLDANPRIAGYFLWSFNDYTRGYDPITAFSGVVDLDRYPKFGYYQMQAMQDPRNPVYGPMVFIASYNRLPSDSTIVVFSNCDEVLLYRNQCLVGRKTRSENASTAPHIIAKGGSPYFRFETARYEAGELVAEGVLDGVVVCRHQIDTAGAPHSLKIELADERLVPVADGSDMVPFYVFVCDERGLPIYGTQADSMLIHIEVSGEGKLIGGNDPRVAVSKQYPEGGIAYGLIRTSQQEGEIVVNAKTEGLGDVSIRFNSRKNQANVWPDQGSDWMSEYDIPHHVDDESEALVAEKKPLDLSKASLEVNGQVSKEYSVLTDGDRSTVWTDERQVISSIVVVNIDEQISLGAYRIYWGKDSDWYTYSLEASIDGHVWDTLSEITSASGQDYAIKPVQQKEVRYLRLRVLGVKPESSVISIREIELFEASR